MLKGTEIFQVQIEPNGPLVKISTQDVADLISNSYPLAVATGGTGSSTFSSARNNLGVNGSLIQIAQRCGAAGPQGAIGGTDPYLTNHIRFLAPYGADAIKVVFPNFYINGGNGEFSYPPSMYTASAVTYSGGSVYAAGDIDTFTISTSTGISAVKVLICTVATGVPVVVQIIDGGLYNTPLSSGASPASSSGSGTGATATFTWKAGVAGIHMGVEPLFGTLALNGPNSVEAVGQGFIPTGGNAVNRELLLPLGDFLVSDLIPVDVPVGGAFGLRISMGYNTPQMGRIPISSTNSPSAPSANYEAATAATTFTDFSISGAIGTTVNAAIFQPIVILGIPKVVGPTVMGIGDSRLYGIATSSAGNIGGHDVLDNDGNMGRFEKALSGPNGLNVAYMPFSNISINGDTLTRLVYTSFVGGKGRLAAIGLARPTAVYLGLNYNDITSSNLATVQSYERQAIQELRGRGVKYVFTDTTDPNTTSTDTWETTTNQTQTTKSANIILRNQMLAAGTWANYDFFIDQRANVESAIDSGLWRVNGSAHYYTGDGVHAGVDLIPIKAAYAAPIITANVLL